MPVTKRESILRRNPYADRRSFVARAMGLSPIGDIASGGMSKSSGKTALTWETSTDWDNAVSESGVVHESVANTDHNDDTLVKMGHRIQDPYLSADLGSFYPLHEDSGSTAYDFGGSNRDGTVNGATLGDTALLGTTGYDFSNANGDSVDVTYDIDSLSELSISVWLAMDSEIEAAGIVTWGEDASFGEIPLATGNGKKNPIGDVVFRPTDASTITRLNCGSYPTNGDFSFHTATLKENDQVVGYKNGSQIQSKSYGTMGNPSSTLQLGRYVRQQTSIDGTLGGVWIHERAITQSEHTTLFDVSGSGSVLTSGTKSFTASQTPDLQNLDYTLNGQTITLDVIASPGTASEEIVSQTLGGSTSYSLTWSSSHTDFRVRPTFDTTDDTVTPTLNRIELGA